MDKAEVVVLRIKHGHQPERHRRSFFCKKISQLKGLKT